MIIYNRILDKEDVPNRAVENYIYIQYAISTRKNTYLVLVTLEATGSQYNINS